MNMLVNIFFLILFCVLFNGEFLVHLLDFLPYRFFTIFLGENRCLLKTYGISKISSHDKI